MADSDAPAVAPAESAPAESAPAESAPAESAPAESAPAESAPAESLPAESAPAESATPAESTPIPAASVTPVEAASVTPSAEEQTTTGGTDDAAKAAAEKAAKREKRKSRRSRGSSHKRRGPPPKPELTEEALVAGLRQLGKTANGRGAAYLTLSVGGTALADAGRIARYTSLQTLALAGNELRCIRALGALPHLTALDVSHNKLAAVLDVAPVPANLRVADFGHNAVRELRDLSAFKRLTRLSLAHNRLERVSGLRGLRFLRDLQLPHNRLISCAGLDTLSALRVLNLSHNRLQTLKPLAPLAKLEALHATDNVLTDVRAISALTALNHLDIMRNALTGLEQLSGAASAALLSTLDMRGNPLCAATDVRLHAIHLLPQVVRLNGEEVNASEKVHAANLHGADAEPLKTIRRQYFPGGELDDGGGALPPTAAGLLAADGSDARCLSSDFEAVDARVAAMPKEAAYEGVLPLAEALRAVGADALEIARAAYTWVLRNSRPPPEGGSMWDVAAAALDDERAEAVLFEGVTGTWAERLAWLFTALVRAAELEAVPIAGIRKGTELWPGETVASHNHAWAAVKVEGRWRLLDPATDAAGGGHAPFFVDPTHWIYSYLPLEAHWQLLADHIPTPDWWALPWVSPTAFFARGGELLDAGLCAVQHLRPTCAGEALPVLRLPLAVPVGHAVRHVLYHAEGADAGAAPAAPPPPAPQGGGPTPVRAPWERAPWEPPLEPELREPPAGALLFQQRADSIEGNMEDRIVAGRSVQRTPVELWAALPGPGEYFVEVFMSWPVKPMRVEVAGILPLNLRIREEECVIRVKVCVPETIPHDPVTGVLVDHRTPVAWLPETSDMFHATDSALLSPGPAHRYESDVTETFRLLVPGAQAVAFRSDEIPGDVMAGTDTIPAVDTRLEKAGDGDGAWEAVIQVPRVPLFRIEARFGDDDVWVELLRSPVAPQVQHVLPAFVPDGVPDPDEDDPAAHSVREMFRTIDRNGDGVISRSELLATIRMDRKYADFLKMPPRIKAADGTQAKFNETFLTINTDKLGYITFPQLAAYMGVRPKGASLDDEDSQSSSAWSESDYAGDGTTPYTTGSTAFHQTG